MQWGFPFANGGKAGTGLVVFFRELFNDFWPNDPVANTWNQQADFAGFTPSTLYDWAARSVGKVVANILSDRSTTQRFTTEPLRLWNETEEATAFGVSHIPAVTSTAVLFSTEEVSAELIERVDLAGSKPALMEASVAAADHQLSFDRTGLSAGIYFVRLIINGQTSIIKSAVE